LKPSIKDQITADLKDAMRARDQLRLDTLRSVISAFNYRRIEAGSDLSDAEQLEVVNKLVKQRADSIESFTTGNRPKKSRASARFCCGICRPRSPRTRSARSSAPRSRACPKVAATKVP